MSVKKIIGSGGEAKWEVRFYTHGRYGKKLRRRFDKKLDADNFLSECRNQKNVIEGTETKLLEETRLEDEISYWLEVKGPSFTEGYFRAIESALKAIREFCGNMSLSKITMDFLYAFRKKLRENGLSVATQNRYIEILVRIINFSHRQGRILKNQISAFRPLREPKDSMNFFNDDEVRTFLQFADKKYPKGSEKRWVFVAYLFALETGLRARELWGVQLRDFDNERNTVRISRQHLRGIEFQETKGKDERVVPISHRLKFEAQEISKKREHPDETLFQSEGKTPIDHENFVHRIFKKDLAESGVKKIRFHDLRHTAITLLVKQNISPWIVQRIAGHKDLKTTLRYVHIVGKDIEQIGIGREFAF